MFCKLLRLNNVVHQTPIFCSLPAHAILVGAENVSEILANLSLVGQACEPAGSRQNAEQRKFRQADCGRAVIDKDNFVTSQCEFVPAARCGSVASCKKL